jgi:hypothetical protein
MPVDERARASRSGCAAPLRWNEPGRVIEAITAALVAGPRSGWSPRFWSAGHRAAQSARRNPRGTRLAFVGPGPLGRPPHARIFTLF